MKKIGIVIDSIAGGGAERVMLTLATEMISLGHSVVIFSLLTHKDYSIDSDIKVVYPFDDSLKTTRGWFNRKRLAAQLGQKISNEQSSFGEFDLFLVNLYESYKFMTALELPNTYYVIHNSVIQELKRELKMGIIKYLYRRSIQRQLSGNKLIGVSKGVSDELARVKHINAKQILQIYNPIDTNFINKQKELTSIGKFPKQKYIIHIGRAAKAKRHDILFRAMRYIQPNTQLICLTKNKKKLTKLAKRLNVSDRVSCQNFNENPYPWIDKAELLVLSSDYEGLPTVLLEALACGTPVVSTDCDFGPNEILRGDLSQFLVPVKNPEALAQAITKALTYELTHDDTEILNICSVQKATNQYLALAI